jgi:hypothetical protein
MPSALGRVATLLALTLTAAALPLAAAASPSSVRVGSGASRHP